MEFIFQEMMSTENKNYSLREVINLMKANPEIVKINSKVNRRWKKFINE